MAILLATIRTEDRFENLWEKIKIFGGAVQAEHQLLDNNEVYSVLAYIARPKSKLEMDTWLGQSVWDTLSLRTIVLTSRRTSTTTCTPGVITARGLRS